MNVLTVRARTVERVSTHLVATDVNATMDTVEKIAIWVSGNNCTEIRSKDRKATKQIRLIWARMVNPITLIC